MQLWLLLALVPCALAAPQALEDAPLIPVDTVIESEVPTTVDEIKPVVAGPIEVATADDVVVEGSGAEEAVNESAAPVSNTAEETKLLTAETTAAPEVAPVETVEATAAPEATPVETVEATAAPEAAPVETVEATAAPESAPVETVEATAAPEAAPAETVEATAAPEAAPVETVESTTAPEAAPVETVEVTAAPEAAPAEAVETTAAPASDESSESGSVEEATSAPEAAAPVSEEAESPEATAAPASSEEPIQHVPVQATVNRKGSAATAEGVTIRFALQAAWMTNGQRRRGYVVKISNKSKQNVCGITFSPNCPVIDSYNMDVNEDGSFATRDLSLLPGQFANQFGYIAGDRSKPTILKIDFC